MPKPLSLDIRRGFQRCIEDGLSGREAARCGPKPGKGKLASHHAF